MKGSIGTRRTHGIVIGLALLAASAPSLAQTPTPVAAVRVAPPAELRRGEEIRALRLREPLQTGDRLVTGPHGRIALQLAGGGQLRLGGDSSLRLHSADYPDAASGGIARLVLERGALRLDALPRAAQLPQDYRLNLGRLRLRVFGGEAFTELNERGESVCLLQGAIEILSDEGSERLDRPGECVVFGSQGRLQLRADTGEALARKLLRTAFADDVNARMAADRSRAPAPAEPLTAPPTPTPSAEPSPPAPATPAAALPSSVAGTRLTVVLASYPDAASAEAAAATRRAAGEAVTILRSETPAGPRFRLTAGAYSDRREAAAALRDARRAGIAEAWLMPLP